MARGADVEILAYVRLIGFEELGNDDAFTTATLELRLAQSGTCFLTSLSYPLLSSMDFQGVIESRETKVNQLAGRYAKPSIRDRGAADEEDWRSDE